MQTFSTLGRAVLAFAATNIDDIVVLTFFFAQKNLQIWQVVLGQYLGIAGLVVISLVGFFARLVIPYRWISLLGIVPIAIGLKKLIELKRGQPKHDEEAKADCLLTVAAITFANGADNIAIYTPLFANSAGSVLALTIITFMAMVALWCIAGYAIANHFAVIRVLDQYGHILVPFIFIALGLYILLGLVSPR